jgi:hypothetical protein
MKKKLARIENTFLGKEDHGVFTSVLLVAYEDTGSSQGVGMYALDEPLMDGDKFIRRIGTRAGMQFIMNILAIFDCSWEQLKGKGIYVLFDDEDLTKPIGVENLAFAAQPKKQFLFSDVFDNDAEDEEELELPEEEQEIVAC